MNRDAWLAVLGPLLGGGVACAGVSCAGAQPAAVGAREVAPWSSAQPQPVDAPVTPDPVASPSPSAASAPVASASAVPAPPAPPPPPRPSRTPLSSLVARTVAIPAQPGPPPKASKSGSLQDALGNQAAPVDLSNLAQSVCGVSVDNGSPRLGGGGPAPGPWLQLTPDIGLSPRPGLDDEAKARATSSLRMLRMVVSSCVTGTRSGVVSVALSTAGAGDGVHAILSAPGLAGDVAGCLRPHLEEHGLFGGDAGPQKLTFRIGVKAGWPGVGGP